jgi:hypothetical protein
VKGAKGRFEIHLTLSSEMRAEALLAHAERLALTPTFVRLTHGRSTDQPMLTSRVEGDFASALARAEELRLALQARGIATTRTKIEVARVTGAAPYATRGYLEHHVKVELPERGVAALQALCDREGAHLSRNVLAHVADGRVLLFCTQRTADPTQTSLADRALASMVQALTKLDGCVIRDVENEQVLEDSNLALDAGWSP